MKKSKMLNLKFWRILVFLYSQDVLKKVTKQPVDFPKRIKTLAESGSLICKECLSQNETTKVDGNCFITVILKIPCFQFLLVLLEPSPTQKTNCQGWISDAV